MARRKTVVLALLGLFVVGVAAAIVVKAWMKTPMPEGSPTPRPQGADWIDLLDDAHAAGWKNITDQKDIFEIKDHVLHIFGRTIYPLRYAGYTAERFDNFDLHLEFKVTRRANSGVFLRAQPNDPVYRGFEVQVLDDCGKPPNKNSCGAIYDVVTPMFNMSRPAGEWNSYEITVHGSEVLVYMNGWLVVHTDLAKMTMRIGKYKAPFAELPPEGNLMLQDHGGEVWYRSIVIRKGAAPALAPGNTLSP